MPVSLPLTSGQTRPTALAAPVGCHTGPKEIVDQRSRRRHQLLLAQIGYVPRINRGVPCPASDGCQGIVTVPGDKIGISLEGGVIAGPGAYRPFALGAGAGGATGAGAGVAGAAAAGAAAFVLLAIVIDTTFSPSFIYFLTARSAEP